ncbi:hypothetical protein JOM56_012569 [Amanita muscaria]
MLSNQGLYSNSGQLAHKGSHIGPQTYVNYPVNGSSQMQINSYPSPEYLSLIGNAPAEALISSANDVYMRIHTEKNELEQERNQLKYASTLSDPVLMGKTCKTTAARYRAKASIRD